MTSRDCQVIRKRSRKQRGGRGFSRRELKEAGTTLKQALQAGIIVDKRRRSVHSENVQLLKTRIQSHSVTGKHMSTMRKKPKRG